MLERMKKTRQDSKVNDIELAEMLKTKTLTECAKHFDVSVASITRHRNRLFKEAHKIQSDGSLEIGHTGSIDSLNQLNSVNSTILNELKRCNRLITTADIKISEQEELQGQLRLDPGNKKLIKAIQELSTGNTTDVLKIQDNIIKISAEVRKQIELQIKIAETLYNIQFTQEFQSEVLEAIKEASTDVRDAIVKKLRDRRVVRGLIGMGK